MAGEPARGRVTYPGYEHVALEVEVERIEPERLFSFRWHPYAVDPKQDYSQEPATLVVFELEDLPEGTRLQGHRVRVRPAPARAARGSVPHELRRLGGAGQEHRDAMWASRSSRAAAAAIDQRRRFSRPWATRRGCASSPGSAGKARSRSLA